MGGILGGRAAGEEVVGVVLGVRVVAGVHHLTNLKISKLDSNLSFTYKIFLNN